MVGMEPTAAAISEAPVSQPVSAETVVVTREERAERRLARSKNELPTIADSQPASKPAETKPQERQLSGRQRAINDAAAKAAESATETLRAENARLKADLDAARRPPAAAAPPAPAPAAAAPPAKAAEPAWKRIAALPGAPQLKDFETMDQYNIAAAVFVNEQLQ